MMTDTTAPEGLVWVCTACGKRNSTRTSPGTISEGWDESCMMHAVLCHEDSLTLVSGMVTKGVAVAE